MINKFNLKIILSALTAIGASACCLLPLVLVMLGIGGSWISTLNVLEPYKIYFIGLTFVFLAFTFKQLYFSKKCEDGTLCATRPVIKKQRIIFWIATVIIILIITSPYYIPLFIT